MRKFFTTIKDGAIKGFKTALMLLKILIPIYLVVVLIKYSPVMPWLQDVAAPVMKIFRLPPEAAVPVVTGLFSDEYGVVTAMGGFNFSMAAITTIAMIALAAHGIPAEAAVAQKIGLPAGAMVLIRLGTAIFTGIFVGWLGGVFL